MTRRRWWLAIWIAASVGMAAVYWSPESWWPGTRGNAEAESFRLLAAARTPAEMEELVEWGVVIHLKAGGWVAIRYVDSHQDNWSSAVARDSGGGWFISDRHFCGYLTGSLDESFSGYAGLPKEVRAVRDAPDLTTARRNLVAMGFNPAAPPW